MLYYHITAEVCWISFASFSFRDTPLESFYAVNPVMGSSWGQVCR